tara:strand:- start:17505 stop:17798 length:294 start_codon:yes stop_codon:yes gene_type:complete
MNSKRAKTSRRDLRLTPNQDSQIEEAAAILHVSVSDFIREASVEKAKQVREDQELMTLSKKDSELFIKAITEDSPELNENLLKAFKKNKALVKKRLG